MSIDSAASVALFAFNRPDQVRRVLESLRENGISSLYVFSDGPRDEGDIAPVGEVRTLLRSIDWIKPEIVERPVNQGIRESMLLGLEVVFSREDRVIVVEDDISVAPEFYGFMNACLDRYCDDERIAGVTGLRYPFDRSVFDDYPFDVFFSPRFSSWGWVTWKRWWETIDFDHERTVSWVSRASDEQLATAGPDVPEMARRLVERGMRFGATTADVYSLLQMIRNRQLFVSPTWNMVDNLGLHEGTHASPSTKSSQSWSLRWERDQRVAPEDLRFPDDVHSGIVVQKAFSAFLDEICGTPRVDAKRRSAVGTSRRMLRRITPWRLRHTGRVVLATALSAGRWLTRSPHPNSPPPKPDPSEYTTTDGPMEVPVQKEAYYLILNNFVEEGDEVLDVGCGIGYGMNLLSIKASSVVGVDVDAKAIEYCNTSVLGKNPKLRELRHYDGYHLPHKDDSFDVATCVDVLEHVERYDEFIDELLRVARKRVIFSTPNRRPEFTNPDGSPRNFWHLREWSYEELDEILRRHVSHIDWRFVNGAWEGPFTISRTPTDSTQALVPALVTEPHG